MLCEKGALKNFANFTGKHLCWGLFLMELQTWRLATLSKRDTNIGVVLGDLRNVERRLFWRRSANDCFWKGFKIFIFYLHAFTDTWFHMLTTDCIIVRFSYIYFLLLFISLLEINITMFMPGILFMFLPRRFWVTSCSILPLSGTLKGPRKSVPLSECPSSPKVRISGTLEKKWKCPSYRDLLKF